MILDTLAGVGLVSLALWLSTQGVVRLVSTSRADRLMACGIAAVTFLAAIAALAIALLGARA